MSFLPEVCHHLLGLFHPDANIVLSLHQSSRCSTSSPYTDSSLLRIHSHVVGGFDLHFMTIAVERERERVQLTFTVVSQSLKGLQYSSIKSCFHGNVTLLHLEWERWNVFPLVNNITDLRGNCASLNTVCCLVLASERVVRQHLPYVYWALPCWRLYLTPQKTTTTTTKQAILILPKDTSNRQVKEMMSLNIES